MRCVTSDQLVYVQRPCLRVNARCSTCQYVQNDWSVLLSSDLSSCKMCSRDQCLAEALNDLRNAKPDGEEGGIVRFVEDYFVNSSLDNCHVESDSESDDSKSDSTSQLSTDDFEIDEEEGPLV